MNCLTETTRLDTNQLERMLLYRNENVISRFTDLFEIDEVEAEDILRETQKFLFICQLKDVFIPDDLLIIDEMWHNLILFTKDYQEYCDRYFGRYFHHLPALKIEKEQQRKKNESNPKAARAEYLKKLEYIMNVTFDHLGEETVIKWFREYPVKYSRENIKALRRA